MKTDELVRQAIEFYDHELRAVLEAEHRDEFLAVVPISLGNATHSNLLFDCRLESD